ncbi:hypothetical protein CEXT_50141 [Caerostris extrusa]|uniref:Uncharacterized protein n=1 Tax=Caerostris extrusa TaxID=172846 RepID=A0AAV4TNN3_CAEEX|nr:hypothetical protein CEXT_50141 [Caerostris extrusa]
MNSTILAVLQLREKTAKQLQHFPRRLLPHVLLPAHTSLADGSVRCGNGLFEADVAADTTGNFDRKLRHA